MASAARNSGQGVGQQDREFRRVGVVQRIGRTFE
jgi:hypothetical protein